MAMVTRLHLDKVLFPQSFHSTQKHLKLFISFLKKTYFHTENIVWLFSQAISSETGNYHCKATII